MGATSLLVDRKERARPWLTLMLQTFLARERERERGVRGGEER